MNQIMTKIAALWSPAGKSLTHLIPVADLAARVYIAKVFFMSGISKFSDWETTLWLFEEEYQVPFLPPDAAAYAATAGELILPVFLGLGFMTRFSAAGLFILNAVAVLSYYSALKDSPAALQDHLQWGIILAMLATAHVKFLTVDRFLEKNLRK